MFVIQQDTLQDDGQHHCFISKNNGHFWARVCGQFRHRFDRRVSVLELSREFFFIRKCRVFTGLIHVLQLPVLRGWNPPCDYWVVGLWFAITVPAFNFSRCRWIHQFWSARISIVMPVPRFMSVFCCSRTTFNVCSSLLTFFGPMKEVTVEKQEWCQSYPYQARFCKGQYGACG